MFKKWVFLCVAVSLVMVGCEDRGRVGPTRGAVSIIVTNEGDWHCDDVELDGEGRVISASATAYLQYIDGFGEPIDTGGLRMERGYEWSSYWVRTSSSSYWIYGIDETGVSGGEVTNEDGVLVCKGWRDFYPKTYYYHNAGAEYRRPGVGGSNCTATVGFASQNYFMCVDPDGPRYWTWGTCKAAPCSRCNGNHQQLGGYVLSGITGNNEPFDPRNHKKPDDVSILINLLPAEANFINISTPPLPEYGVEIAAVNLVQQRGGMGEGFVTLENNGFMPSNNNDPNLQFTHGAPYMYSYSVLTSEPIETGLVFSAVIKSDTMIDGVTVGVRIVASNTEKTAHIARTDYFIPMDTEFCDANEFYLYDRWTPCQDPNLLDISDPNFTPDTNRIKPAVVIPMETEGDYIQIKFVPCAMAILELAPNWLTDDKTVDINGDGIVNFKDWAGAI